VTPVADRRVVLVTGTRTGIGRHLAQHLLATGAMVEGCSRGPAGWAADGYTHHQVDVTAEAPVKAMLASIRKRWGRLDALVNNAGIASMNHALLTPRDTAARILDTNVLGTFLVSREAAKLMQRGARGRIVNLTTVAVPLRLAGEAVYAASKAAVETLTRVLARELAEFRITCNAVGPMPIDTDLIRNVPREKIDALLANLAIHRPGTFDDVANVVDFFLRPESDAVTGQVIYLGGV
jgi:3-oxoacyl-[acyl-carrier protein] reductase